MPVPSSIDDLSTTAGANSPSGSETPGQGDDYLRVLSAFLAQIRDKLNGTSDTGTIKNPIISGTSITWPASITHSGDHTFSGNVAFNGNTAIGNATTDTLTVAPTAVTWGTTTTHSGAHVWSGAQTFDSNPSGKIFGAAYTPTFTNVGNFTSAASVSARYTRVGNIVSVSFGAFIESVGGANQVDFILSLPVASNIASIHAVSGTCSPAPLADGCGAIFGDVAADGARCTYQTAASGGRVVTGIFAYEVV